MVILSVAVDTGVLVKTLLLLPLKFNTVGEHEVFDANVTALPEHAGLEDARYVTAPVAFTDVVLVAAAVPVHPSAPV